ncbi:porin [Moraxella cuniculi]|uniref:Outer membrane protein (Porin) n=1 Tax=Moraxella cuniculi TaxID=34061 RepID=A0A3S4QNV8_9GAMM|nr:porin [Moraxella cuniculi]VEG12681.1 Outer membrane protein (porin) [Moraxella cuniculi]
MKKSPTLTAIIKAISVATPPILLLSLPINATAEPKISGRFYLTTLQEKTDKKETNLSTGVITQSKDNRTTLNSAGSRVRLTGSEKLTDDVDLEYRLEYSVYLDNDGNGNNFASRNTYLGLKHKKYGTMLAGRLYTPDDDIDYVNWGYLYAAGTSSPFGYHGQRTNNTIQYTTPKFNDGKTQIKLHYAMDEVVKDDTDSSNGGKFTVFGADGKPNEKRRDMIVGHMLHESEKFDTGIAYTSAGDFKALRAMVSVKPTKELTVGLIAQQTDYNSGNKELGALVSGYYKLNQTTDIYAQAGTARNYKGYKDGEKTTASTGVIKWLKRDGARVRVFGSLSYSDETSFKYDGDDLVRVQSDALGLEAGLRYDF